MAATPEPTLFELFSGEYANKELSKRKEDIAGVVPPAKKTRPNEPIAAGPQQLGLVDGIAEAHLEAVIAKVSESTAEAKSLKLKGKRKPKKPSDVETPLIRRTIEEPKETQAEIPTWRLESDKPSAVNIEAERDLSLSDKWSKRRAAELTIRGGVRTTMSAEQWFILKGDVGKAKSAALVESIDSWCNMSLRWREGTKPRTLPRPSFCSLHPCLGKAQDATQFNELDQFKSLNGASYASELYGCFAYHLDFRRGAGQIYHHTESEQIMAAASSVAALPCLDDNVFHSFLSINRYGLWRCEYPIAAYNDDTKEMAYIHATTADIAEAVRHHQLLDRLTREESGPHLSESDVLVSFDAFCTSILEEFMPDNIAVFDKRLLRDRLTTWRTAPVWGPFLASLVARLSALPLPSLEKLGEAGEWWLGKGQPVETPFEHACRISFAHRNILVPALKKRILAEMVINARELLQTQSGFGCAQLLDALPMIVTIWLDMRLVDLPNMHTLATAWVNYVFAPDLRTYEYTPLSFNFRTLSDITVDASNRLTAIGRHFQLLKREGYFDKFRQTNALTPFAALANPSADHNTTLKRLRSNYFEASVFPPAESGVTFDPLSFEAVNIMTYCRAYDTGIKPGVTRRLSAIPFRVVARNMDELSQDQYDTKGFRRDFTLWAPIQVHVSAIPRYYQACIEERGRRLFSHFAWNLGAEELKKHLPLDTHLQVMKRVRDSDKDGTREKAVSECLAMFHKLFEKRAPSEVKGWKKKGLPVMTLRKALRYSLQACEKEGLIPDGAPTSRLDKTLRTTMAEDNTYCYALKTTKQ